MIKTIYKYIRNYIYKFRIKLQGKSVRFLRNAKIDRSCVFEGYNSIGENVRLSNCFIGFATYISMDSNLVGLNIGRFCSLGSRIYNTRGNHPTSIMVSTHPAFFSTAKQAGFTFSKESKFNELRYSDPEKKMLVDIGNDVWIGDNVTIKDGVTIGDGAIIGSNSLVNKDIEPYSINVGIPTKIIKYRFTKEEIELLLQFKWWNRDFEWIKKNYNLFENIDMLKEYISNKEV